MLKNKNMFTVESKIILLTQELSFETQIRDVLSSKSDFTQVVVINDISKFPSYLNQNIDLIIVDLSDTLFPIQEILKLIYESGLTIPCVIYSNFLDERSIVDYMRLGVYDCLSSKTLFLLSKIVSNISSGSIQLKLHTELEKSFEYFAKNINEVMWIEQNDKIFFINSIFEDIFGFKKWEIDTIRNFPEPFIHFDDVLRYQMDSHDLKNGRISYSDIEYRFIRKDGEERWIWARRFAISDPQGKIQKIAGISSDITEKKKIEQLLIVAKNNAELSDKLKTAFLANLQHEVRTPMNGIMGFIDLIKVRQHDEQVTAEFLNMIYLSCNQLLDILNNLITLSKIEIGDVIIKSVRTNINSILMDTYSYFKSQKIDKEKPHIQFVEPILIPNNQAEILLDPPIFLQILNALLDNSLKFTNEGFIQFGCKILPDNRNLEIFVKDSGIGIPDSKKSILFDRFTQADMQMSRGYGGLGIGLYLSKKMAELMGGSIEYETTLHVGSVFKLIIPYKKLELVYSPKEFVKIEALNWKNRNILVVEDDDSGFYYLQSILEATGSNFVRARDGMEAVDLACSKLDFDVILMDLRMPKLNGYEATEQILKQKPYMKIVALTANVMNDEKREAMKAGCCEFLTKPVKQNTLLNLIQKLIGQN